MGRGKPRINNTSGSTAINKKKSDAFLTKNLAREEVEETSSGLQYEVLSTGEGGFVESKSLVTVEQKITLIDGKVVSDTARTNTPESFVVKECIKGYREGLLLMNEGDSYKFFIPSHLAWHKKGIKEVPASSVVIIECTVLSID